MATQLQRRSLRRSLLPLLPLLLLQLLPQHIQALLLPHKAFYLDWDSTLSKGACCRFSSGGHHAQFRGKGITLRYKPHTTPLSAASPSIMMYQSTAPPENASFSEEELDSTIASLRSLVPLAAVETVDWAALRALLVSSAHLSHKDWARTEAAASRLADIIGGPGDSAFDSMFERVLEGGNWAAAVQAAEARPAKAKPWVVLVTGVNGIRKTSSVYQAWFKEVLAEALGTSYTGPAELLPDGGNSFFRQLDFMLATVANTEFRQLYAIDEVDSYARRKDEIFVRYRTVAEMLGALLVRAAAKAKANLMVETSGRDIGMFRYIDHFFTDGGYNKMVVHFTIDEIERAEASVDARMLKEMVDGRAAMGRLQQGADRDRVLELIGANAGGPYGSAVLKRVQAESQGVWERVCAGDAGDGWYKACVRVCASKGEWTVSAQAREESAEPAKAFTFAPRES